MTTPANPSGMSPSDEIEAQFDALLERMTLDEKIALMSGVDFWSTLAVPRVDIPKMRLTDGPNGARGDFAGTETAACFPVGAALAASWNVDLVREVGVALGEETRTKGAQVLLAPTINLQRTPVGGRNFECFSEDPHLTSRLAVTYVEGVQSVGVAACAKHYVANDTEFQRHTVSSNVDERTLRELYLPPFEAAVKEAGVWSVMSAYNRINGVFASSHGELLNGVLKSEWGFDGVVVSDWGAALQTVENANGGLDLEMPGPARAWGVQLRAAVDAGAVSVETIDDHVRRLLRLIERVGLNAEPVDYVERSVDKLEHRALARRAAAEGMVLIKNDDDTLPLTVEKLKTIAVIGPNAAVSQIQGGGSSGVRPHYVVNALEGLERGFGKGARIIHEPGCATHKYAPAFNPDCLVALDGTPGALTCETFGNEDFEGEAALSLERRGSIFLFGAIGVVGAGAGQSMRLSGTYRPDRDGEHVFGLVSAGFARLFIDDVEVIDNWTDQTPGESFFGFGSAEKTAAPVLIKDKAYSIRIEYSRPADALLGGLRFGVAPPMPVGLIERAASAAAEADAVILVLGSNSDWETEGHDRQDMALPGEQNALAAAVLKANPNAVVVMNAGAPVEMPWIDDARALLWTWFPGQEFGNALYDVLTGAREPGGRSPLSMPMRLEDHPAYGHYPAENGNMPYKEGLSVGYRHYDRGNAALCVPFGHGLGYAAFKYLGVSAPETIVAGEAVRVNVILSNAADRAGSEVVQLYVRPLRPRVSRPDKELKGFKKLTIAPGESVTAVFDLDARAFSYWDETRGDWRCDPGDYEILIGRSAADTRLSAIISLA